MTVPLVLLSAGAVLAGLLLSTSAEAARRDSRKGGIESFSPSVSSGSSTVKPGLGVASSKSTPLGSR